MINQTISYCIASYNQEKFIADTIQSVLRQDYPSLEVIISDDNSTDKTFSIIKTIVNDYQGSHKIILNRNESNIGIGGHFSKIMNLCNGKYIIFLGGDDIAKPNHASIAFETIKKYPEVNMVDFNAEIINEKGEKIRDNKLKFETKRYFIKDYLELKTIFSFAPGRIFNRELIDSFEEISENCPTEDSILVLRSLLTTGFIRANISPIYYRIHSNNASSSIGLSRISNHAISSQYIKDITSIFNSKKISSSLFKNLLARVLLDLNLKELKYSKKNNIVVKPLFYIYKQLLKGLYFIESIIIN